MANSIRTTSNTQTTLNAAPAIFKAGDAVLCLSLTPSTFLLIGNLYGKGGTQ